MGTGETPRSSPPELPDQDGRKWNLKVLRFDYCVYVGDTAVNGLLRAFGPTLERFQVTRNFYENVASISDDAFDLKHFYVKVKEHRDDDTVTGAHSKEAEPDEDDDDFRDDDDLDYQAAAREAQVPSYSQARKKNSKNANDGAQKGTEDQRGNANVEDQRAKAKMAVKPKHHEKRSRGVVADDDRLYEWPTGRPTKGGFGQPKPLPPLTKMEQLRVVYSRFLGDDICPLISQYFPNLKVLQLTSCPIGVSDCSMLGPKYLPSLVELDLSGDSFLSKETLSTLSLVMTTLRVFHLGHFEHSDYSCSQTVIKKVGQSPLRGLYVCELLKDPSRFPKLELLYMEIACDLTHFILHQVREQGIRKGQLQVRFDRTKRNIEDKVDQLPFTPACHQANLGEEFEGAEYEAGYRVNMQVNEIDGEGDVGFMYGENKGEQALDLGAFLAADGGKGDSAGEDSDGDEN